MDETPVLTSYITVDVSLQQARAWFMSLSDHPERYQFDSHKGFRFTRGRFGEPGARFQTTEQFKGVTVTLKFELEDVAERRFTFRLIGLLSGIWGYFALEPLDSTTTDLSLAIGSDRAVKRWFLELPVVRRAVLQQIDREVAHIQRSMESLYQEETWAS